MVCQIWLRFGKRPQKMAHEKKTEKKVGSCTTGDKNVRIQTGLDMQRATTKPEKERTKKKHSLNSVKNRESKLQNHMHIFTPQGEY